jgi:hypothetical protein
MRFKVRLASSLLLYCGLLVACDRNPLDPTGAGGAGASGGSGPTISGSGGANTGGGRDLGMGGRGGVVDAGYDTRVLGDPGADPNCSVSPASYQDYVTEADLEALLVRRWKRCVAPQIAGEDIGVEFTADGHYYPLTSSPDGVVVRRTGVDYEGTWQYFPVGSTDPFFGGTTTRAEMLLSGVLTDAPKFTNDPRQLRITFSPVLSRYLPLDP